MQVAVIGTGLTGKQVARRLTAAGHEGKAHSRSTGVDLVSGAGLEDAVRGAEVVVDLIDSPTFDETAADFFRATTRNLLAAAERAGVRHVVVLSIVGVDRVPGHRYYAAKTVQEDLVRAGTIPYSIVRATQFHEFVPAILDYTTTGDVVRLPPTPLQPVHSAEASAEVVATALGDPVNGHREVGGPEVLPLDELGRMTVAADGDRRSVVTDETAGAFALVDGPVLTTSDGAHLGTVRYRDWLRQRT